MVHALLEIGERENRILEIVKGKYGLKNKSQAINMIITDYSSTFLEPELRPEFIERMKEIDREETINIGSLNDFKKRYGIKE